MKKTLSLVLLSLVVSFSAAAQVTHDVNDSLYRDLDRWATRGYVTKLPSIRPYPLQLVTELLAEVVSSGSPDASAKAREYLEALGCGDERESMKIHVGALAALRMEDSDYSLEGAPTVDALFIPNPLLAASVALDVYGTTNAASDEIEIPGVFSPYADFVEDQASVGSLYILQRFTSMASVGTDSVYFQAGISRNSFGPFFDNGVVLGPQAPRTGHFSLGYRGDHWSFGEVLLTLMATDNNGENHYPDKYLILHTFDFYPSRSLEFGFSETVVWGDYFGILYLAPFTELFAAQSLTGFEDNSLFDVHGSWMPFDGFKVLGQVYVDDLSFNDLVKLKLDTKYKLAGELGLKWVPDDGPKRGFLSSLAADYTAVMPYMYTHIGEDRTTLRYSTNNSANYWNYTTLGECLGADLDPNSDRLSIRSTWRLMEELELGANAELRRHGNASDNSDYYSLDEHDGSIFDDGYTDVSETSDGRYPNSHSTPFLTQDIIETLLSGGLSLSWTLPTDLGSFSAQLAWTAEYGWNRDLESGNDGWVNYLYVGAGWKL